MSANTPAGEARNVAIDLVELEPDFNPRSGRDRKSFEALVASVRREGVLQPVLLRPAEEGDGYVLVAGEGRYLAAVDAGLTEIPALVRQDGELSERLVLALCENLIREDLDPVEQAAGFRRLIDSGLTKKGVAERLSVSQKLVTERLAILELPEEVQEGVATGEIPPGAIKALVSLARINAQLPTVVCKAVGAEPAQSWREPLGWSEVVDDPIGCALGVLGESEEVLIVELFDSSEGYPLQRFELGEAAEAQVAELCGLMAIDSDQLRVRFDREALEQATALGAAHAGADGWRHMIVGQDVANQLAGDFVAGILKRHHAAIADFESSAPDQGSAEDHETGAAERKAQREADAEHRRAAHAHNTALGAAVLKALARLRIDTDLIKVLSAIDVGSDLPGIAARGARYGFPDWFEEAAQKNGKVKVTYLDRHEAGAKAAEFVDRAKTPSEIAGRLFCLIAMAHLADEEAVARSNRSYYELRPSRELPWGDDALRLVEKICAERLPEQLVKRVEQER